MKKDMNLESQINQILFKIGQDITIHKIDPINSIIEIDYDKYTLEIMQLFYDYLNNKG